MRRNWIQFNTRGPRACQQAHCLLLARLASPPYHLSDQCLCAPGAFVCVCVCVCACVWLEKPEQLLESGHDLAVTHRNREERRSGERGERRQRSSRRWKTSWSSVTSEPKGGRQAVLMGVCGCSALLPQGALSAVFFLLLLFFLLLFL